jgi:large subunit ribosomal protein L13
VDTLSFRTISANKTTVQKEWLLIDAKDQILGRLASAAAKFIRGKHKSNFTPHVDCGDNVIIINAEKVRLSGKKLTNRQYLSHTGYPGGQQVKTPAMLLETKPKALVEHAVKGMLPRNRLGRQLFRNLYVYLGSEHPHEAQKPKEINLKSIK